MQQSIKQCDNIQIVSEVVNNCDTIKCVRKVLAKYVGSSILETDNSIIYEIGDQKITFVFDDFGLSEIIFEDDEKSIKILNYSSEHGVNDEYD